MATMSYDEVAPFKHGLGLQHELFPTPCIDGQSALFSDAGPPVASKD